MTKYLPIFTLLLLANCSTSQYPISDHFDGDKFYNPWLEENIDKSIWKVLKWRLSEDATQWPESIEAPPKVLEVWEQSDETKDKIRVTLINHATVLVQLNGLNILTDPIYSERTSPVSWAGPTRVRPPAIRFEELPRIDIVVVSHNHYDHLDLPTLAALDEKFDPVFLVPLGNASLLESVEISNVKELDWWDTHLVGDKHKVTLTPAQHWSARGLFDKRDALWGGYVISSGKSDVFFAGDTGYGPHFKMIRKRFESIDLSLLPIGAYEPRWFMKNSHVNPNDSVKAHMDLESKSSFGIHFGTFQLTNEGIDEPPLALAAARQEFDIPESEFIAPEFGRSYIY